MESTLLLVDCVAIVIVVLWYARNVTRAPGAPIGGLLRFRQRPRDDAAPPTKTRR
jgi:hypothetical protein